MDELRNWSYIFRPSETRTHNWSHVSRPLASERGIYGMDKLRNCTLFASLGPRPWREEFKEWKNWTYVLRSVASERGIKT